MFPNAAVAFSLRKLNPSYSGSAIRVRRSSDNAEQDIGFAASGALNTSALTSFVGSNNGFITVFYDQSGNSKDVSQTNSILQPQIVSSGSVINLNSKPCIQFTNSLGHFLSGNHTVWDFAGDATVFHVSRNRNTTSGNYGAVISQGGGTTRQGLGIMWQQFNSANTQASTDIFAPAGVITSGTQSANTQYIAAFKWQNWSTHISNGNSVIAINGTNQSLTTHGSTTPLGLVPSPLRVGSYDGASGAGCFLGDIQEIVVYTTAFSATDIDKAELNLNAYYAVY